MSGPTSISQIDLSPLPGKTYFTLDREWREEFIYFLMVDRFHDSQARIPVPTTSRSAGFAAPDNAFYGGTIQGITQHLDYIAGLGCTAIWITPVFENNPGSYHGYDINNYLDIDPHFGTKQDLVDLVAAAHAFQLNGQPWPIRIILDVVINNSGDNWMYPGDAHPGYSASQQLDFGDWRRIDRPVPTELRNPGFYHRRGQIGNYDADPEKQLGDIATLKDFENDDDPTGSEVVNILITSYCYWIREADIDGFRVDAVKHLGDLACSWFSSNIREYAYSLGKRDFFLFGEVATPDDDIYNGYLGPNTSIQDHSNTVFFGLDSVLDFRLAESGLRSVIKGFESPQVLFDRLEGQRERALNRGELGRYLVTFVDNHDSFWQMPQGRFANGAPDSQVIGAIGFLLCALGTPCIYYGTEQGFVGHGGDNQMREAMFDNSSPGGTNLLNPKCNIFAAISQIAEVMRQQPALRFGRMYYRQISGNAQDFGLPFGNSYTLAFSRMLYGGEVLVLYNVGGTARKDSIIVDAGLHVAASTMRYLYGGSGSIAVEVSTSGGHFITVPLTPYQFAILQ